MKLNIKDIFGVLKGNFEVKKAAPKSAKTGGIAVIGVIAEANLQPLLQEKGIEIPPGAITSFITIVIQNMLSWWKHRK